MGRCAKCRLEDFETAAALLRAAWYMQKAFRGDDPKIEGAEKELERCRVAWKDGKWTVARKRADLAVMLIDKISSTLYPPRAIAYEYKSMLQLAKSFIINAVNL